MNQNPQDTINDLIAQTNCLNCTSDPIDLESDPTYINLQTTLTLVGQLVSDKPLNRNGVKNTIVKAWNPPHGIKIREQENRLLLTFKDEQELQRVLDNRPWSIMGANLVLQPWPPEAALYEVNLSTSPFWVRVCGLPPNKMTRNNAITIGARIGKLVEIETSKEGKIGGKGYMRLRIEIEIKKLYPKASP
ncbi:hypothetical protein RJ639_013240 [Escallonia herrerae]|uniref:DUF4283 domain-containing protein n=1 Tax=Escallonia herrerae TaxID=1293975 RepID=A0AA89AM27_9ASTE|nr:hypothetical protein RJ639_013240 [Escallonia herrerae]